jgi:hypothetical protein
MSLMPSCKDITEHASDYLDRNLPWWKRTGYRMHLLMCTHCQRYLSQLQLTIDTLGKSADAQPPIVDDDQVRRMVQQMQHHAASPPPTEQAKQDEQPPS